MKKLLLFLLLFTLSSHAKVIQILHIGDLHSFFEGTRDGEGGYSRLKTLAEMFREEGKKNGIPTLFLDAGDTAEGSSFYFADRGVDSFRALDLLGLDATVMGNHDFMLGGKELKRQLEESKLKARFLSNNLKGRWRLGLGGLVENHVDYNFDGIRIRVAGISNSEIIYQYPFLPIGFIESSHKSGIKAAGMAKRDGVDFLIALTHSGIKKDIVLAQKTRTLDLIVGGHSHLILNRPQIVTNLEGQEVPILHAGAHSNNLGRLLIDVLPGGESKIVSYEMLNISPDIHEDPELRIFVEEAKRKREVYFGRKWNEVIGYSEISLSGASGGRRDKRTCWSRHIARLTRTATKSDLGMQFDLLQGEKIPAGPITFGDIVDNFPHFRNWGDKGWKMTRSRVSGFLLKKVLEMMAHTEMANLVTIDGLEAKTADKTIPFDVLKHHISSALINGAPISNLRYYTLGLPSEITYALFRSLNVLSYVILNDVRTIEDTDFWPLLENYVRTTSPIRCL